MMLLPKIVSALLAARQMGSLVPSTYCSPQCPECKQDILQFDGNVTSCQPNSTFISNCGTCQTCVLTYAFENGGIQMYSEVEDALALVLNMCADASNPEAQEQIEELNSQASRISSLAQSIEASTTYSPATTTATASSTKEWTTWESGKPTEAATATGTSPHATTTSWPHDGPDWTTILTTATWASRFLSYQAMKSAEAANVTAFTTPKSTSTAGPMTESNQPAPLSQSWIAGPIVGSILGMSTVFVVIYCTRMKGREKKRKAEEALGVKDFNDNESENSEQGKAQLHSECVPVGELDNTEFHPPVELPAVEPVGNELLTPRSGTKDSHEEWPLPLSPLPLLFAQAELRDERTGQSESPKHETFYHK